MRRFLPVLLAVLVAACTTTVDGRGTPAGGAAAGLPPRPFEIRLDDVDPCALLTEPQRAELGLNREPIFDSNYSPFYRGETPACTTPIFDPVAFNASVAVVTSSGAEVFFDPGVVSQVSVIDVRGFPAVLAVPQDDGFCTVALDVAAGQLVDVQYADGGREPAMPQPDLCDGAVAVAGAVMDTLLVR